MAKYDMALRMALLQSLDPKSQWGQFRKLAIGEGQDFEKLMYQMYRKKPNSDFLAELYRAMKGHSIPTSGDVELVY